MHKTTWCLIIRETGANFKLTGKHFLFISSVAFFICDYECELAWKFLIKSRERSEFYHRQEWEIMSRWINGNPISTSGWNEHRNLFINAKGKKAKRIFFPFLNEEETFATSLSKSGDGWCWGGKGKFILQHSISWSSEIPRSSILNY